MERNQDLKLHVWEEIISLLKYEYNKINDYKRKEELTRQIIEAAEMIIKLQERLNKSKVS